MGVICRNPATDVAGLQKRSNYKWEKAEMNKYFVEIVYNGETNRCFISAMNTIDALEKTMSHWFCHTTYASKVTIIEVDDYEE